MRFLLVLKKTLTSGGDYTALPKSGLLNSANFIKNALEELFKIETKVVIVEDSNGIDKEVADFKPTHTVIEAIFVPPYKLKELAGLHPHVYFIVRIHSKTTFLANEGIAMKWIREYEAIKIHYPNVQIAFNAEETYKDFKEAGFPCVYLPNFYKPKKDDFSGVTKEEDEKSNEEIISSEVFRDPKGLHIGLFGAVRPLKNHLTQAIAAIQYANTVKKTLYLHINGSRIEQNGVESMKNLDALFNGDSKHKLIKWPWLSHDEFIQLVKRMDCGMQVSLTESFNIVSADFVANDIPIITSNEVDWMPWLNKTTTGNSRKISHRLNWIMKLKKFSIFLAKSALLFYNFKAYISWERYLDKHKEI